MSEDEKQEETEKAVDQETIYGLATGNRCVRGLICVASTLK